MVEYEPLSCWEHLRILSVMLNLRRNRDSAALWGFHFHHLGITASPYADSRVTRGERGSSYPSLYLLGRYRWAGGSQSNLARTQGCFVLRTEPALTEAALVRLAQEELGTQAVTEVKAAQNVDTTHNSSIVGWQLGMQTESHEQHWWISAFMEEWQKDLMTGQDRTSGSKHGGGQWKKHNSGFIFTLLLEQDMAFLIT